MPLWPERITAKDGIFMKGNINLHQMSQIVLPSLSDFETTFKPAQFADTSLEEGDKLLCFRCFNIAFAHQ